MNNTGRNILTFLTGAVAGTIAGILLAPNSGKKTREIISQKANDLKEDLGEVIDHGTEKIKQLTESAFTKPGEITGVHRH